MTAARIALFVVIALTIAVAANLALLGIASGPKDPVGQLNPRAGIVRLPPPSATTPPPAVTPTGRHRARRDGGQQQDD